MAELTKHTIIMGIDEAGRGPLAGPVVAAGVVLDRRRPVHGLKDSKKLLAKAREDLYQKICLKASFFYAHEVDVETIDSLNILQATLLAMRAVIERAMAVIRPDLILIDGRHTVDGGFGVEQRGIIGGDGLVDSIMAASIVAKVHRDRLMMSLDQEFPGYGFARNKGYGTADHREKIRLLGPCAIHRRGFSPVREMP